nr:MAG TPA: hypothetical protein [Caudoviricetes sp.]
MEFWILKNYHVRKSSTPKDLISAMEQVIIELLIQQNIVK